MAVEKAVYKCPVCGYLTHFEKAMEAHQRHRKHFPKVEEAPVDLPETIVTEEAPAPEKVEKKTRKPRAKKTAQEKEN